MKLLAPIVAAAVASAAATLALVAPAAAEKSRKTKPTFVYAADMARDGTLDVRLANPGKSSDAGILSVLRPSVNTAQRLIAEQDWYLKVGKDGTTLGIYTVPRGGALPSNVTRGLTENESVMRIRPGSSFLKVFPDAAEMNQQVRDFTATTRDAVCALKRRPEQMTARLDIAPGWAAKGNIRMEATWKTSKLCATVKTAKAD